jgi:polysaccharide deacetylase 2 family uncharacterized protein YibQ
MKGESMAKRASRNSSRLKGVAVLFIVLFVASFGLYRYFQTAGGLVFLLDAGLANRFGAVQKDIGTRIVKTLRGFGVQGDHLKIEGNERAGDAAGVVVFRAETAPDASLIQINGAIAKTLREVGARVRSCREGKDGRMITMEIGTRRALTHRCIIRKGSERQREALIEEYREVHVVALCVDDFGFFRNALVRDFLALDIPLTISVIPGLKYSERIARDAGEARKDVICHLPMEAEKEGWDSGEIPLIRTSMNAREIEKTVAQALEPTPGVIGMNNHMGSKATADRKVMEAVLRVCRVRSLYFFDSMTTSRSVVRRVARELGVPTVSNDLFIDTDETKTRDNMKKLLSIAARRGSAVGIVHVKAPTLADLRWMIDEAEKEGIRFITISEMINRRSLKVAEGGP